MHSRQVKGVERICPFGLARRRLVRDADPLEDVDFRLDAYERTNEVRLGPHLPPNADANWESICRSRVDSNGLLP